MDLKRQKWLVITGAGKKDGVSEIVEVEKYIKKSINDLSIYIYRYDGSLEKGDERVKVLRDFEKTNGVLVACQMMNEGVDVNGLSRAIIMASSQNETEWIQRKGRVLRINRSKKSNKDSFARIWDLLVLPDPNLIGDDQKDVRESIKNMIKKEIVRAENFAKDSSNEYDVRNRVYSLKEEWGIESG